MQLLAHPAQWLGVSRFDSWVGHMATGERMSTEYWLATYKMLNIPRKSVVRITDGPNMTSAGYVGHKAIYRTKLYEALISFSYLQCFLTIYFAFKAFIGKPSYVICKRQRHSSSKPNPLR